MITDPIADLFTRIRNAQKAGHPAVRVRCSKVSERILAVLKEEGFVADFDRRKDRDDKFDEYEVALKYFQNGEPAISSVRRISTPGRRVYSRADKLSRVQSGLGISLVSTSQGILSDREARKRKIGGELLAFVS
jgi:small subunit ribosomal protein S8